MARTLKRPANLTDVNTFCAGCGHGMIIKALAGVLEELGVADRAMGGCCVGCGMSIKQSLAYDSVQAPHGRAAATSAAMKIVRPDAVVISYQGDGDAGSIGIAETIYQAKRNENITVIFINNGVYGMTGGQTAPTSLADQHPTTSRRGTDYSVFGEPLHLAEMLATMNVGYIARGSVANPAEFMKTRAYIKRAIECQLAGGGYSFVEVLAPCPTNWKMTPLEAMKRIEDVNMKIFPCGELKGREENA